MQSNVEKVVAAAMKLSERERADLAAKLLDSLDSGVEHDIDAAWQAEIERRVKELDSGDARTVPWSEVQAKARGIIREQSR